MSRVLRRYGPAFLRVNLLCVLLAAVSGGLAHLIAATLAREIYELAIGDRLLPGAPVDSWLWGPILIGTFVSWWTGLIAAPFVFLAGLTEPCRASIRPIKAFVLFALLGWAFAMVWEAIRTPPGSVEDLLALPLMSLLGPGYLVLGFAFASLAGSRRRGRSPEATLPPDGSYPHPVD